jgi:hypothetical protein
MLEYAAGAGLAMVIYHRLQSADAMSTATGCGLLGLGVASLAAIDTLLYNRLYGDNVERAWLRCAGLGHCARCACSRPRWWRLAQPHADGAWVG